MSVFKCAGRTRKFADGSPYCDYQDEVGWRGKPCPGCGFHFNCDKIGAEKSSQAQATLASLAASKPKARISTGILEIDTVLSAEPGGLVRGATYLISGPPGCGKSTLLLGVSSAVAKAGKKVVYASGEQSADDLGDFARRLKADSENVLVMGMEGDIYKICDRAEEERASLVVVDSLQTAFLEDVDSYEGSGAQCKAVASYLTAFGKRGATPAIVVVCQVNKDGDLAGPRSAEHEVDTIMEFDPAVEYDEDEVPIPGTENLRRLMMGKNRHGPSSVSCLLEMTGEGIKPFQPPPPRRPRRPLRSV